jgi:hypothetical protein
MGREVRRVPKDWEHPIGDNGHHIPLHDGDYRTACEEYQRNVVLWNAGCHPAQKDGPEPYGCQFYWQYAGSPPAEVGMEGSHMYEEPRDDLTHYQLYETTSEGTPIGPVFDNLDDLCEWAADNATTFASFKATAEEWKSMLSNGLVYATQECVGGKVMFL